MIKVLLLILLSLIISGCVGGAVYKNKKIDLTELSLSSQRGKVVESGDSFIIKSKVKIKDAWGSPDKIICNDNNEYWHYYHTNLSWKGLLIILIVPIPMILPTDHDELILTFENENLKSVSAISSVVTSGFFCSLFNVHGYPSPQCSFASDKEEQEDIDRSIKKAFKKEK